MKVNHLRWHPHNFGASPESCMAELDEILDCFKKLQEEYGMKTLTMPVLEEHIKKMFWRTNKDWRWLERQIQIDLDI